MLVTNACQRRMNNITHNWILAPSPRVFKFQWCGGVSIKKWTPSNPQNTPTGMPQLAHVNLDTSTFARRQSIICSAYLSRINIVFVHHPNPFACVVSILSIFVPLKFLYLQHFLLLKREFYSLPSKSTTPRSFVSQVWSSATGRALVADKT
jgi:hypothetical protein